VLQNVGHALRIHHRPSERVDVEKIPALLPNNREIELLHERLAG
jgi:hypothetical protein